MKRLLSVILVAALVFCAHLTAFCAEKCEKRYDFEDFYGSTDGSVAPTDFVLSGFEAFASQEGIGAGILSAEGNEGKCVQLKIKSQNDLRLTLPHPDFAAEKGKITFSIMLSDYESEKKVTLSGKDNSILSFRKGDGQIFMLGKATGLYAPKDRFITFTFIYDKNFLIAILYDTDGFITHMEKGKNHTGESSEISFSLTGESLDKGKESSLLLDSIIIENINHISDAYMKAGENFVNDKGEENFEAPFHYKGFGSVKAEFYGFSKKSFVMISDFSGNSEKIIETDENGEVLVNGKKTGKLLPESKNVLFSVLFCPMTGAGAVAAMTDGTLLFSKNFYMDTKFSGAKSFVFGGNAEIYDIFLTSAPPFYIVGRYYDEFAVSLSSPQNGAILKEMPNDVTIVFNQEINIISLKNSIYVNGSKLNERSILQIDTYSVKISLPQFSEGENCIIDIIGGKSQRGKEIYDSIKFGKYYTKADLGIYNSDGVLKDRNNITKGTVYGKTIFTLK